MRMRNLITAYLRANENPPSELLTWRVFYPMEELHEAFIYAVAEVVVVGVGIVGAPELPPIIPPPIPP